MEENSFLLHYKYKSCLEEKLVLRYWHISVVELDSGILITDHRNYLSKNHCQWTH